MTRVYTDQLAALPITEIVIMSVQGGIYVAFVALEGKLLRIYELDNKPLSRRSIGDIKSVLCKSRCDIKSYLVHHSAYDEMIGTEFAIEPGMKIPLV
jgi:hypothetical protein